MRVFAIVVTYNGAKWLDKCLGSLLSSTVALNIIVIDNGSTDNTISSVKEKYSTIKLIETGRNLGFGKANNIGIKDAIENKADYVFLLNQDAYIQSDTIDGLIEIHRKNTSYGIISPMHLNGSGSSLDYNFSTWCNATDCPDLLSDLYVNDVKEIYPIKFVNAAFWLIPVNCILKAGLFDPFFHHYGEDVDYSNRVKYFGFNIGVCPGYMGYHDRELRPKSDKRNYMMRKTTYIYVLKNINKGFTWSIFFAFFLLCRHIVISLLKLNFKLLIEDFKILFYSLSSIFKIYSDRRKTKQKGAFINADL